MELAVTIREPFVPADRAIWRPPPPAEMRERLARHLRAWLGAWPPTDPFTVVGSEARVRPGWDGRVRLVLGVAAPDGLVLSVPPQLEEPLARLAPDRAAVEAALRDALGEPHARLWEATFRWSEAPATLPDTGIWLPSGDPRVPPWLTPFGGGVLVAFAPDGALMAGVGIKRHDRWGHELAVVTEAAYRGQGLARSLVAQAARRVIDAGAVPTYLHADSNLASARVADAVGFPDRGWRVLGFHQA